jgi:hypothetical protein
MNQLLVRLFSCIGSGEPRCQIVELVVLLIRSIVFCLEVTLLLSL